MTPLRLASLAAVLALAALAPAAAAVPPQVFGPGPLDFDLVAQGCSAQNVNPPGVITFVLTDAVGIVNGVPVNSPAVGIAFSAPGSNVAYCAAVAGGMHAAGQVVGVLVAA